MPLGTEVDIGVGHIVLDGFPALRERGTALPPPLLGPCLLWPRSPISATAELLSNIIPKTYTTITTIVLRPFVRDYPGEPVPEETLTHPPS